jgi:outer membrane protein assembly factor BamB
MARILNVVRFRLVWLCLAQWLLVWALHAADWPRFGGPDGTFVSSETGLARSWPEGRPRVLWQLELGEGFAGAAVRDGLVYVLDRPDDTNDVLRCLDLASGGEKWRLVDPAPGKLPFNGSRNVPTVDDQFIFVVSPFGRLSCIDRHRHQKVWEHHLVDEFRTPEIDRTELPVDRADTLARAQLPTWGMTQAPLLYRDLVIVAPQTREVGLVAYEKTSGKIRWKSGYLGRNWYSHVSPSLASFHGVDQIIMLAQPSDPEKSPPQAPPAIISATDANSGKILWTTNTPAPFKIPIPQPLSIAPNRLFISGGYGLGCLMLQISRSNENWATHVLWHNRNAATHIHSPVFYRDRIYLTSFKEHGGLNTGLVCLTLEGKVDWQTGPKLQFDSGGFIIADGLALVMHGKTGVLYLIELGASEPKFLATAKVLEGRDPWAPLALSQGKLLVRDQRLMKCLELR